jgi:3-oxoacyl-[acyl-carrier protein] reductase
VTGRTTFDFRGAIALVTGGTSGIGLATAATLRDAGAAVTVTGTKPDPAAYTTDLAGMTYRQLVLTDTASIHTLAEDVSNIDILINNAGANFPGGLDESTPDGFRAALALNLLGPFQLTTALHDSLAASTAAGGASVVNLASMSAIRAVPLVPGYGSAKAGIVAMTRNLAVKWAADGIRVNAIVPGLIDTPMTTPVKRIPKILHEQLCHIPLARLGTVEEIAATIVFLCTEHSSYTTGSIIIVDGAFSCL